ncbi:MAG: replication factor C small subunit [Candidatus Norongarragalinales archaeon]
MASKEFIPWVEKYRPRKLRDVIGHEAVTKRLEAFVRSKNLPHLLFCGPPGSGKTACALAMAHELYGEAIAQCFMELNASDERGIDVVRGKIKDFARTLPLSDVSFKLILLDECDSMTSEAQQALRRTMETFSGNTRFVLSANYSSRIIEPIQSRCAVFRFPRLGESEVRKIVDRVAEGEGLKLDDKARDAVVYVADGDARKAINVLQGASGLGEKKVTEDEVFKVASRARPKEVGEMVRLALRGDFLKARALLDDLMMRYGLSGEDVIAQVYREIVSLDVDDEAKLALVERVGEYDFRIGEGANERVQLEALLARLALAGKNAGDGK